MSIEASASVGDAIGATDQVSHKTIDVAWWFRPLRAATELSVVEILRSDGSWELTHGDGDDEDDRNSLTPRHYDCIISMYFPN